MAPNNPIATVIAIRRMDSDSAYGIAESTFIDAIIPIATANSIITSPINIAAGIAAIAIGPTKLIITNDALRAINKMLNAIADGIADSTFSMVINPNTKANSATTIPISIAAGTAAIAWGPTKFNITNDTANIFSNIPNAIAEEIDASTFNTDINPNTTANSAITIPISIAEGTAAIAWGPTKFNITIDAANMFNNMPSAIADLMDASTFRAAIVPSTKASSATTIPIFIAATSTPGANLSALLSITIADEKALSSIPKATEEAINDGILACGKNDIAANKIPNAPATTNISVIASIAVFDILSVLPKINIADENVINSKDRDSDAFKADSGFCLDKITIKPVNAAATINNSRILFLMSLVFLVNLVATIIAANIPITALNAAVAVPKLFGSINDRPATAATIKPTATSSKINVVLISSAAPANLVTTIKPANNVSKAAIKANPFHISFASNLPTM